MSEDMQVCVQPSPISSCRKKMGTRKWERAARKLKDGRILRTKRPHEFVIQSC